MTKPLDLDALAADMLTDDELWRIARTFDNADVVDADDFNRTVAQARLAPALLAELRAAREEIERLRESAVCGWRTSQALAIQYGAWASERVASVQLGALATNPKGFV